MRLGADMLEVDIHASRDGKVVVIHDGDVDRTTNGSGSVYEMRLRQIQRLDAAHNFVPGVGTSTEHQPRDYAFRGVRTGERPAPRGFRPRDFRIPTLAEVMRTYPTVPINIEIKGRSDDDVDSFIENAERLAATLERIGRTEGIIVASFNDAAIARFQQLMPEIDLAPSISETTAFKLAGVPPGPGKVAFQVPITFQGIQVTDRQFVEDAHAEGLAVHVWLSSDPENDQTYNQLLDWGVDAVMPAAPAAFERVLCKRDVARPPRPRSFPGSHCNHRRVSIACDVVPARIGELHGRRVAVRLQRSDEFEGGCNGRLTLRVAGDVARERWSFGRRPPSAGASRAQTLTMRVSKAARKRIARRPREATLRSRAYQAYGGKLEASLRRG
jgi:glycerophosphoryl diester phosphodiesterase